MATFHDDEQDRDFNNSTTDSGKDREIHLSNTFIVGIFFALTLLAAVFFGFGYTMGRHSGQTAAIAAADNAAGNFSGFKPAPGNPAIQPVPGYLSAKDAQAANANASTSQVYAAPPTTTSATPAAEGPREAVNTPIGSRTTTADQTPLPTRDPAVPIVHVPPPPSPQATQQASAAINSAYPNNTGGGPATVQIAAVSHQEDADVLLSALRRKGYNVAARQEPQDRLIHIQIGPFPNKKEAEATRQRLLADGYNAIVK